MRECLPKYRFLWDRKHRAADDDDEKSVDLEVLYRRQRKWIGTGVKVSRRQWDEKKSRVKLRRDMLDLNDRLSYVEGRISALFAECMHEGKQFEFWMVDSALDGKPVPEIVKPVSAAERWKQESFLDWVRKRVKERKDLREGTLKTHLSFLNKLEEYNAAEPAGKIETFGDLVSEKVMAWDEWMHTHDYMQTTIYGYHKRLKRYINEALVLKLVDVNPYVSVKIKRGKSDGIKYLTSAEVEKISALELSGTRLEKVRDLFLFQCYTGLAYADLAKFKMCDCEERDGRLWLRDERVKSEEEYSILIMKQARDVLDRWGGTLPVISNQQYNLMLKVIAEMAKVKINLTTHVGRHTFAVMALNAGVSVEVLAKMMGHTQIQTTQLYAKILGKSVEKAFIDMENKI